MKASSSAQVVSKLGWRRSRAKVGEDPKQTFVEFKFKVKTIKPRWQCAEKIGQKLI